MSLSTVALGKKLLNIHPSYLGGIMIEISPQATHPVLLNAIYKENLKVDKVDVIINNLLALQDIEGKCFEIPFDDVITTLETALFILNT